MDNSDEYDYARIIYEAGENAGVSPYFLASRIIQEMGYNGESALYRGDLTGFEGYYNYYNIKANIIRIIEPICMPVDAYF